MEKQKQKKIRVQLDESYYEGVTKAEYEGSISAVAEMVEMFIRKNRGSFIIRIEDMKDED